MEEKIEKKFIKNNRKEKIGREKSIKKIKEKIGEIFIKE